MPVLYFSVPTYILMGGIGLAVALMYIWRKKSEINLDGNMLLQYILICALFALVGARVLFVIAMIPSMNAVTMNELAYYLWNGGIVFYGGLFGVILGIVVISKRKHVDCSAVLDFAAPAFSLFHAFARLGCLLTGCCYGIEWEWGVVLADEPDVIRFPVQFFESLCDIGIFIGLTALEKKRKSAKGNMVLYLVLYAVCRFILEFYRGDQVRGIWFGGLSTSQYISILVVFICVGRLIYTKIKSQRKLIIQE